MGRLFIFCHTTTDKFPRSKNTSVKKSLYRKLYIIWVIFLVITPYHTVGIFFFCLKLKKQSFCSLYLLILSKAHKFLILPLVLSIQNTWIWFAYHLFLVFQKLIYCSIDLFWKCNCFSFKYHLSSSMELCKNSSKIHVLFEL